ncbi:L-iditol 2-dehydrogenase [Arthrobacter sp. SLBN-100]|uniref:zinc-dependent alcohol dehydrogenase n=1 Tax=Arthrobacter sp. SLBN-100 TaxID=2768450 RepID=UPI0011514065|nr:zinc-binding dehydrogenase [Arthrobacter sp. SLBN-100]TQJ62232.1 L-iditol 2-dehydrogenase [Arthrobacter sp. SLBN-100]
MRAVIYKGPQDIVLEERPMPTIGPKDVLVKNMRTGICGTDTSAYMRGGDDLSIFPGNEIGHEFVSEVVEVGAEVDDERITPGLRVWVEPLKSKRLGEGRPRLEISTSAGGMSQYISIHDAAIDYNLFPLPDAVSWDQGVIVEPFSVANHGVNIARPKPGERALIYGAGAIGLGVLANLRAKGIEDVVVCDVVQKRLDVVAKMGGIPVDANEIQPLEFVLDRFGSVEDMLANPKPDVDMFFDAAGAPHALQDYIRGGKPDSRMVVIAVSAATNTVEIPQSAFVMSELNILGSMAFTPTDIKEVIDYIATGTYDPTPVITHHFAQEDAAKALETAAKNKDQTIKVVVDVHP